MYKELRKGFTTGTCAAIAAGAAARMAQTAAVQRTMSVVTPTGIEIEAKIEKIEISERSAVCAVRKDAGDDPDATDGVLVYARVTLRTDGVVKIDGGEGVGRVTKPGLWQKIGEAAINKVPREMIERAVRGEVTCGADVVISIPEGVEIAKKTFNPRLGIVGGISVLGTTGIVEPMSSQALIDTIEAEIRFKKANGADVIVAAPGNYGIDFLRDNLGIDIDAAVKCSNFIGDTIDLCIKHGVKSLLLVGHVGKFVKLGAGIMNTHSHNADGRVDVIIANAALCGVPREVLLRISECIATDDALGILQECGMLDVTMERIMKRIEFYINGKGGEDIQIGVIMFSNIYGILGKTPLADKMLTKIKGDTQ